MESMVNGPGTVIDRVSRALKKHYDIIRIRFEIDRLERKRNRTYLLLGKRLHKLIVNRRIELPEQKKLMDSIAETSILIDEKTEELVNLVQS